MNNTALKIDIDEEMDKLRNALELICVYRKNGDKNYYANCEYTSLDSSIDDLLEQLVSKT